MTKSAKPKTETMSARELAKLLGLAPKTIANLATEGVVARVARGRYDVDGSVRRYTKHLRKLAEKHEPTELAKSLAALTHLKADALARENAAEAAQYVRADEAAAQWEIIRERLRAGALDVVGRVRKALPTLDQAALAMLQAEIEAAISVVDQPVPLGKPGPKRRAVRG